MSRTIRRVLSFGAAESVARGLNWALIAVLPLLLPTAEYGLIGLIVAIEAAMVTIVIFGQDRAILRFGHEATYPIVTTFVIPLCISALLLTGAAVAAPSGKLFFSIPTYPHILLLAASISLVAVNRLMMSRARVSDNLNLFIRHRTIVAAVKFVLVVSLALWLQSSISYLFASIASIVVVMGWSLVSRAAKQSRFERAMLKRLFLFGWPFVFHAASSNIIVVADRFMIEYFQELTDVAVYTLAYTFGFTVLFVYTAFSIYMEPRIYKSSDDLEESERWLGFFTLGSICLGGIVAAVTIVGFKILQLYSGDGEYAEVSTVIGIIIAAHLLVPVYLQGNFRITVYKKTRLIAVSSGLSAVINLVLNFILIPKFGILGAALATYVSYVVLSASAFGFSLIVGQPRIRDVKHKFSIGLLSVVTVLMVVFYERPLMTALLLILFVIVTLIRNKASFFYLFNRIRRSKPTASA